jgi:hypothetical protein
MTSDQPPIHFDEKIERAPDGSINWGKLSIPKRFEVLNHLRNTNQLTPKDCDDFLKSLENIKLNIDTSIETPPDPNFSTFIDNAMSEILAIRLELDYHLELTNQFEQNQPNSAEIGGLCTKCNRYFFKRCINGICHNCCHDPICPVHRPRITQPSEKPSTKPSAVSSAMSSAVPSAAPSVTSSAEDWFDNEFTVNVKLTDSSEIGGPCTKCNRYFFIKRCINSNCYKCCHDPICPVHRPRITQPSEKPSTKPSAVSSAMSSAVPSGSSAGSKDKMKMKKIKMNNNLNNNLELNNNLNNNLDLNTSNDRSFYKCYKCNDPVSSPLPVDVIHDKTFEIITINDTNFHNPLYCSKCHIDIYKNIPFK